MAPVRDPLSVRYDRAVRRALLAAIAAARQGRPASAWVASPGPEFRQLDRGGRTKHERAFTRSAYYQVINVPRQQGQRAAWSLKLTWGPIENRRGRYGRTVQLRMFRAGSGARYAKALPASRRWADGGALRSEAGNQVDANRRAG